MREFFEAIVSNKSLIVVTLICIIVVVSEIIRFCKLPSEKQHAKIKKCLLAWVVQAEKELGSGTGKLKLSTVYGLFVTTFPVLKNFISFDTFSGWVDDALNEMEEMLSQNDNLQNLIKGDNNNTEKE